MKNLSTQLLVIGGGVTGLGIAWDAALRGIKTILVEKSDLGQGTSGRYHGLLHSGARYALSDPTSAADCAKENPILRLIAANAIEDTGGYFVSTPTDPLDYPDRWRDACAQLGIACEELATSHLLEREPALNPRISRAFQVADASLDSFDLVHLLAEGIYQAGGKILLHHEVKTMRIGQGQVQALHILDTHDGQMLSIDTEFVVNAAGPWSGHIAKMAGVEIALALGKGTMLAMAQRFTNAVINRCKPPSDGDIIVPVGTVCVLGTTDVRVESPDELKIEPWEIELLLTEGELLIPGLSTQRALRAWAGIRALETQTRDSSHENRGLVRAHRIIDHRDEERTNFFSVYGGKLTTFRLMAEEVVDLIAKRLRNTNPSTTSSTPLPRPGGAQNYNLSARLDKFQQTERHVDDLMICECELITNQDLERHISAEAGISLDDLRRDSRLGMGPCQAAFCGYRAAGLMASTGATPTALLNDFTQERWKGIRSLIWGTSLRQIEMHRRINLELLRLTEVSR